MHVLLGLINYSVGSGIDTWMTLWMSWGTSCRLGFLMAPLCGLLLSGHLDIVLCILSQILGQLRVFVVGI